MIRRFYFFERVNGMYDIYHFAAQFMSSAVTILSAALWLTLNLESDGVSFSMLHSCLILASIHSAIDTSSQTLMGIAMGVRDVLCGTGRIGNICGPEIEPVS